MPINNSLRQYADQIEILDSIVARLIDQIPNYNEQNCFVSDDPLPDTHSGGNFFCTVAFGDATFPGEFFSGGGHSTLTEDGTVIVSPTVLYGGERVNRARRRVLEDNDHNAAPSSLSDFKRLILKTLLSPTWEPNAPTAPPSADTRPLLRDLLSPRSASGPGECMVGERKMLQSRIVFSTVFDWDLTT